MVKREINVLTAYEELEPLEPIFHTKAFGLTVADAERRMVEDYWETGASGCIYDRTSILEHLKLNPPVDAEEAGWVVSDRDLRTLSDNTFLITYSLRQEKRRTRRSTIWWFTESGWQILYHQGTLISSEV